MLGSLFRANDCVGVKVSMLGKIDFDYAVDANKRTCSALAKLHRQCQSGARFLWRVGHAYVVGHRDSSELL